MLFNSYEFIFIYLPIVVLGYFTLAKYRYIKAATAFLAVASLFFYAYWDIRYLGLLVFSIVMNNWFASLIEHKRSLRILFFCVGANFTILGYFKYMGFFLTNLNLVFGTAVPVTDIVLPLGISFFTFTQTAYLVDVYRGETRHYPFVTYLLFVTVFPHLIAGPIIYHRDMIPQFSRLRNFVIDYRNIALGMSVFSIGLFKKTVLADNLAPWANHVFANVGSLSLLDAWIGAFAYMLQLYFDFSGYSEMAIGLGLLFNFKFPVNFLSPYKATSFIDFWRRWHITLSIYLRNYLYIPLGGNRRGMVRKFFNIFVTFLLGGLWHGAGWTYVLWGGSHGVCIVVNHLWRQYGRRLPLFLSWLITFTALTVTMVIFRAASVSDAVYMLRVMFDASSILMAGSYGINFGQLHFGGEYTVEIVMGLLAVVLISKSVPELVVDFKPSLVWAAGSAILFVLSLLTFFGGVSEFLYFQF